MTLKAGESSTRCCSLYFRFFLMAITALCELARSLLYTEFGGYRLRYLCQQHKGLLEMISEVLPVWLWEGSVLCTHDIV